MNMTGISNLIERYKVFRASYFEKHRALYHNLAATGQKPRALVISCCDSRVDPNTIFDTMPGELFVVRNVANLVPPYQPDGNFHGTSAALEFAVSVLAVEDIIVLGHADCGGIKALTRGTMDFEKSGEFINKWMSIAVQAIGRAHKIITQQGIDTWEHAVEQASILNSLENIKSFPFVTEKLKKNNLTLHGWYFDITTGDLLVYEDNRDCFLPVK